MHQRHVARGEGHDNTSAGERRAETSKQSRTEFVDARWCRAQKFSWTLVSEQKDPKKEWIERVVLLSPAGQEMDGKEKCVENRARACNLQGGHTRYWCYHLTLAL